MKTQHQRTRWRAWVALGLIATISPMAGCSEMTGSMMAQTGFRSERGNWHSGPNTEISGMSAKDVFKDPQTLALVEAACHGDIPKIDALVKQGANVNATGYRDMSVLAWAMVCTSYTGVKRLLELGANPNQKMPGTADDSPMWIAAGSSDPHWLPMMLAHGGDPNIRAGFQTALMGTIEEGRINQMLDLIEHGANVNEHDSGGNTAATYAAALAKFDVVEMLLKHGYNYNLQDLANSVEARGVPAGTAVAATRQKVLELLAAKGYRPTPRPKGFVVLPFPPDLPSSSSSGGNHQ